MKIGVCALPENLTLLSKLGYDYFESNFRWMTELDDETFNEKTALIKASPLKAETFCIFFPKEMKLYAPDRNQESSSDDCCICQKPFLTRGIVGWEACGYWQRLRSWHPGRHDKRGGVQLSAIIILKITGNAANRFTDHQIAYGLNNDM